MKLDHQVAIIRSALVCSGIGGGVGRELDRASMRLVLNGRRIMRRQF